MSVILACHDLFTNLVHEHYLAFLSGHVRQNVRPAGDALQHSRLDILNNDQTEIKYTKMLLGDRQVYPWNHKQL